MNNLGDMFSDLGSAGFFGFSILLNEKMLEYTSPSLIKAVKLFRNSETYYELINTTPQILNYMLEPTFFGFSTIASFAGMALMFDSAFGMNGQKEEYENFDSD